MGTLPQHILHYIRSQLAAEIGRQATYRFQDGIHQIYNSVFGGRALEHHGDAGYGLAPAHNNHPIEHIEGTHPILEQVTNIARNPQHPINKWIQKNYFRNKGANLKRKLERQNKENEAKRKKEEQEKQTEKEEEKMAEEEQMDTQPQPVLSNEGQTAGESSGGVAIGREEVSMHPLPDSNSHTFSIHNRIPILFTNDNSDQEWSPLQEYVLGQEGSGGTETYDVMKWNTGMHFLPDKMIGTYINKNLMKKYFAHAAAVKFNYAKWNIADISFYQKRYNTTTQQYELTPAINQQLCYLWDNDGSLTHTGKAQVYNNGVWNEDLNDINWALPIELCLDEPQQFNGSPLILPKFVSTCLPPTRSVTGSGNSILTETSSTVSLNQLAGAIPAPAIHKKCHIVSGSECEGHLHHKYEINTPWLALNGPDRVGNTNDIPLDPSEPEIGRKRALNWNGIFAQDGEELTITMLMNMKDQYSTHPDPWRGKNITDMSRGTSNLLFRAKPLYAPASTLVTQPIWVQAMLTTEISCSVVYDELFMMRRDLNIQLFFETRDSKATTWQVQNYVNPRARGRVRQLCQRWINEDPKLGPIYNTGAGIYGGAQNEAYGILPFLVKNNYQSGDACPAGKSDYQYITRSAGLNLRSGKTYPRPSDERKKPGK